MHYCFFLQNLTTMLKENVSTYRSKKLQFTKLVIGLIKENILSFIKKCYSTELLLLALLQNLIQLSEKSANNVSIL